MIPGVRIKKSHGKIYLMVYGKVYVPQSGTVLGEHDVVDVYLKEGGIAEVHVKHYPPETWVLLD